jgi:outer membrane protein assembly factor BamB
MKKALLLGWFSAVAVAAGAADSWPAFRGANSSGVSGTATPPVKFGPEENVLWKTDLPGAPSSPCVWGDRIFVTAFPNGKLETRCYDRGNGKLLWSRIAPAEKLEEFHGTEGSPAASTPVTDGQNVVSYFGSCGLVCYDFAGKELWRHELPTAVTAGNFGSGTSPLIAGDLVILNRDQAHDSSLIAVNLKTGKKAWETPRSDATTSYGSVVLWGNGGVTEAIVSGSLTLKAYDTKTGAERWRVRGLPSYTCTTPVVGDGMLFSAGWSPGKADSPWPSWESTVEKQDKNGDGVITVDEFAGGPVWFKAQDINGDGKLARDDWESVGALMKKGENVMLAIKPGGSGDVTETHVAWKFTRGLPYVPSPLFYQGRVYVVKDGGMVTCVDAKTGQPHYSQERINAGGSYYASPVAADGRIYVSSLDGKVTVFEAGGDKPEILHQVSFKERIAATPALVGNQMYLRTASKLYALGK